MNNNQQANQYPPQPELMPYYYHLYYQQLYHQSLNPQFQFPHFPPPPMPRPQDPRKKNFSKVILTNKDKQLSKQKSKNQLLHKNTSKSSKQQIIMESQSSVSDEEFQQIILRKKTLKKDPILDSADEIKKWIQSRKKNYPSKHKNTQIIPLEQEMSIMQNKIRKKLQIINSDPKAIFKKLKNMDVLKRIILSSQSKKIKKITKKNVTKTRYFQQPAEIPVQSPNKQEQIIQPQEIPIQKQSEIFPIQLSRTNKRQLQPQQIITHLRQKQKEDKQWAKSLLQYKTNSLNYKYTCGTLEVSMSLEDLFKQSSYLIQAIRYIVKNDFFTENQSKQ